MNRADEGFIRNGGKVAVMRDYPPATQTALRIARGKARRKRTCRDRLIITLADGRGWVSARVLDEVAGFNFGRRLREARAEGIKWEWQYVPRRPKGTRWTEYRLIKKNAPTGAEQ